MNSIPPLFFLAIVGVATSANMLFLITLAILEGHSLNARGYLILLASIICLTHSVYYLKSDRDDRMHHLRLTESQVQRLQEPVTDGEQDDD